MNLVESHSNGSHFSDGAYNRANAMSTDLYAARTATLEASGWGTPFRLFQLRNLCFWVTKHQPTHPFPRDITGTGRRGP